MKTLFITICAIIITFTIQARTVLAVPYITYETGNIYQADSMAGWDTTGNEMVGMVVTAFFENGGTDTAIWAANAGAVGTNWSLTLDDYNLTTMDTPFTDGALWTLDADPLLASDIKELVISGHLGNVVWDAIQVPEVTPGSEFGWPIVWSNHGSLEFAATYRNSVQLPSGAGPQGDLYETLALVFDSTTYFGATSTLQFRADTDNAIPPYGQTPEPVSMVLFGSGLLCLGALRKKKRLA